jgi:NitT/TauT family transport system permease protein
MANPSPALGTRPDLHRVLKIALPLLVFALVLWAWESYVQRNQVPPYVLPAPSAIAATLVRTGRFSPSRS